MSYIYFNTSTFPMLQSLQLYQNYQLQANNYFSPLPSTYYDFQAWNQPSQIENYSPQDQKFTPAQFETTQSYEEAQNIVEVEKKQVIEKKRQKNTTQKEISSAKKNSESNIINQFYSFFSCSQKSEKIALKAIHMTGLNPEFHQKILSLFYSTIRAINVKRGRKYVNRALMLNYFTSDMLIENLPQIKEKLQKVEYITLQELCQVFRRCCQAFLKIVSIPAILTSKRITGISKEEHFKKRRKILKAITGY